MHKLIFSTTNARKIKEAIAACEPAGIQIIPKKLNIEEIQNIDGKKVALHKAKEAFKILKKPLVINDAYWEIPALKGFPGPYMKDIDNWFTVKDWQNLLTNTNRKIICYENIVYIDKAGKMHFFEAKFNGIFVNKPSGSNKNQCIERLISFDGGKNTLANYHDNKELAFNIDDYCWAKFVNWYTKNIIQ